jgi:hypothetical protein
MPLNTSGTISLLRVHDRGTAYGPPSDRIDVEVVIQFVGRPADAFGFQLRDDANGPARQGMLDLLRDAFNHGWRAWIDYEIQPGKKNGTIIRTWVTKPSKSPTKAGASKAHTAVEAGASGKKAAKRSATR